MGEIIEELWALHRDHKHWAREATRDGNTNLHYYHSGKAFAYEHAARMLEEADAS